MRGAGAALVVLIAATLVACRAPASPGPALTVDCAAFETEGGGGAPVVRKIQAGVDQTFEVTLCSNPSTGFGWEDPVGEGGANVELVERAIHQAIGGPPGAAGEERFTFRTLGPGDLVLHFVYSQPWDGGTKGAWSFDLITTIIASEGAS